MITEVQTSLPYFSNIPEDVVTNTLHFIYDSGGAAPGPTQYGILAGHIQTFFNAVYAAVGMGSWCNKSLFNVTMYDLQQPTPRVPVYNALKPITVTTSTVAIPTEVAICMSFAGITIPGINPARQRGRIFVGGIATGIANGSVASFPNINSSVRGSLCTAMSALLTNTLGSNWDWIVYSRTNGAAGGQESFDVGRGWVDDTPDTQRRRGVTTTNRTIWP